MKKDKKLKYAISFITILFFANILHWKIIGLKSVYSLTVKQFQVKNLNTAGQHSSIDTLVILEAIDSKSKSKFRTYIDDISDNEVEKIKYELMKLNTANIVSVVNSSHYYEKKKWKPIFDFSILRSIPLYCNSETDFVYGGGSNAFRGQYVYFFSWIQLKVDLTGIS